MNSKHFAAAGALILAGTVAYVFLNKPPAKDSVTRSNDLNRPTQTENQTANGKENQTKNGTANGAETKTDTPTDTESKAQDENTAETKSMTALPAEEPSKVPTGEPTADELKIIEDLGGEEPEQSRERDYEFQSDDLKSLLKKLDADETAGLLEFRLRFGFSNRQLIEIRRLNARRQEALSRRGLSPDDSEAIEQARANAILEMLKGS